MGAEISNGLIHAEIKLPDAQNGFYRGTRFDWSGVIYSLTANGHNYYGPWFTKTDPAVHDFVYRGDDIVAGPCSAITGPVDEFAPIGFDAAKPGENFIKIGIGALRKNSAEKYDNYYLYEIADGGKWTVMQHASEIYFRQNLSDRSSGYAYVYEKDLRLTPGKAEMILTHTLKNTGKRRIETNVYNHNFLVLDGRAPGPGVFITVPFTIHSPRPPKPELAEIRGNQIVYLKNLEREDTVATPIEGFSAGASDNTFHIEAASIGAGMSAQGNRPLLKESLWSIRSVMAVEPFISISVEPGQAFSWNTVYKYYLRDR